MTIIWSIIIGQELFISNVYGIFPFIVSCFLAMLDFLFRSASSLEEDDTKPEGIRFSHMLMFKT